MSPILGISLLSGLHMCLRDFSCYLPPTCLDDVDCSLSGPAESPACLLLSTYIATSPFLHNPHQA